MLKMTIPGKTYLKFLLKRAITIVFTWNIVMLCIFGSLVVLAIFAGAAAATDGSMVSGYRPIYGDGSKQLLSIKVHGVITGSDEGSRSIFSMDEGQTAGYTVKDQLYIAANDAGLRGVILEIDSPGGTIFGARAIADGVAYYKQVARKPVYAHISGTGASGAYWAAISADKVFVDHGSDVGSIGVIMGPFEYYNKVVSQDGGLFGGGVVTQNGIESVTLTAGKSKDVGNPYRRLTAEEINVMQKSVNNEYDDFVRYVSQRRLIPEQTIRANVGAMTYDAKTAQELKLVDGIANRQDAYDLLADAANVKDDYQVVTEEYVPGFVESLFAAVSRKPQPKAQGTDLCTLAQTRLAYHGDVTAWCKK